GQTYNRDRFDGYCTYTRLGLLGVAANLEDKVHQVTIKVLSDKIDKAKILFEQNRADLEKNPAKYEPGNWYAGAIFLIGSLVN
ncbi:MAG: SGNH/GDSL hydrolase family protein, partial [Spirochaetia bacterium]|nr:SGNH/GDSL hydrolase family protein [Spirochaetia bacterium]